MNELHQNMGALASKVIQAARASGLSWDESVAALGLASKALADGAAKDGDGTITDCHAHAKKRFTEAFAQQVQLIFAGSAPSLIKKAYEDNPESAEAILANAHFRIFIKPH